MKLTTSSREAIDKEIIDQWFEETMKGVIESQTEKGLRASGESAKKLRVGFEEVGEFIARGQLIDGSGSFGVQEYGRKGGKVPKRFAHIIYDWLAYKKYGITYKNTRERRAIAYQIAKKIALKGTYTHINNQQTNVLYDNINQTRVNSISETFAKKYSSDLLTDIKGLFK